MHMTLQDVACDNKNGRLKGETMTREDVKKLFPDATDEQITALLNQVNSEGAAEKNKAEQSKTENERLKTEIAKYKADAERVTGLEKRLSELKDAAQKANAVQAEAIEKQKQLDESSSKVAELEKMVSEVQAQLKRTETMKALADRGIVGEDAETFFNEDGSLNFDTLGKVISDREKAAAEKKEQAIANNSTNPGGGSNEGKGEAKPYDVEVAERISFSKISEDAKKVRDYYKK